MDSTYIPHLVHGDTDKVYTFPLPHLQIDLSFLLDRERGCECLNDDNDHPYTNALHSGPEYLESDGDEQVPIIGYSLIPRLLPTLCIAGLVLALTSRPVIQKSGGEA